MRATILAVGVVALTACSAGEPPPPAPAPAAPVAKIVLTDVTEVSGVSFEHTNGASPRRYLPETMGSGVAVFDADGDGDVDLYFANARPIAEPANPVPGVFYLGRGDGGFEEATREAGLDAAFYGLGTAVGDVDNDGDLDLFVSGLDGDRFFRNLGIDTRGRPRFAEATAEAGLDARGFGSSAAFLDFDRDGRLDLFVGRYVEWSRDHDVVCSPDGQHPSYCTPEVYAPATNRLYRNLDGRRFEDVTLGAGLGATPGKTLGVVPVDVEGDGWPDLAIANDTSPNALFLNQRDGTFRDAAVELGVAYSLSGATRGAMGIDAGDLLDARRDDLVVGNFAHEMSALYRATEYGLYTDEAAQLGIGLATLMRLSFGTLAVDLDGDGELDVVFANGHIEPDVARFQRLQSYAQPLQIFRNLGGGAGFEEVEAGTTGALATPWVGRGLAAGDLDSDGDLDLVLTQNGGRARLLRNDSPRPQDPARHWLRVKLVGRCSNRTGYGALLTAVAGEKQLVRRLVSGRSYLSASEPVVTFGLGQIERLDRLEIAWPSGFRQEVEAPGLDQLLVVDEPAECAGLRS